MSRTAHRQAALSINGGALLFISVYIDVTRPRWFYDALLSCIRLPYPFLSHILSFISSIFLFSFAFIHFWRNDAFLLIVFHLYLFSPVYEKNPPAYYPQWENLCLAEICWSISWECNHACFACLLSFALWGIDLEDPKVIVGEDWSKSCKTRAPFANYVAQCFLLF